MHTTTNSRNPGYLQNSTDLSSPLNLTIPPTVGPSASYYSIALLPLTTSTTTTATYSNRFALTAGTGNYTAYENHLGGAAFWDANDLPCSSYNCARTCAMASYPDDLTEETAYATMKKCILACPGVSRDEAQDGPAQAMTSSNGSAGEASGVKTEGAAIVTLGSGTVVTAVKTTVGGGSSAVTEAVVAGSKTLTLGGAGATVSGAAVSLVSNGLDVAGSTTVAFSTMTMLASSSASGSQSGSGAASATDASASATSSGAAAAIVAVKHEVAFVGFAAGVMATMMI